MISVLMGVRNAENTVERAVRSLRAPEGEEMEIICVDDASTDGTRDVLRRLEDDLGTVVAVRKERRGGLAAALNEALSLSGGEWIARMDADDVSQPDRLERELAFLKENPGYGFVGCAVRLFDANGVYAKRSFPETPGKKDLVKGNPFIHPTLLFRRETLERVGGYRSGETTMRCEDYELMFRLYAAEIRGYNLSETLLDYFEDRETVKHTRETRRNEMRVRKAGYRLIGVRGISRLQAYKPVLLGLLPRKAYRKLHRGKDGKL